MNKRLKELREIYETRFHTIPHTQVFGELLDIAEGLKKDNQYIIGRLKDMLLRSDAYHNKEMANDMMVTIINSIIEKFEESKE